MNITIFTLPEEVIHNGQNQGDITHRKIATGAIATAQQRKSYHDRGLMFGSVEVLIETEKGCALLVKTFRSYDVLIYLDCEQHDECVFIAHKSFKDPEFPF